MEVFCTSCCKEKSIVAENIPAIDRYLDPRIRYIYKKSLEVGKPFLILSGKFGLITPEDNIPWYDKPLLSSEVAELSDIITKQLVTSRISSLDFYGLSPEIFASWEPYYDVLKRACDVAKVALTINILTVGELESLYPHFYSFVGDFGSGKTTLLRSFAAASKYFVGEEFFDYLKDSTVAKHCATSPERPRVLKFSEYRDELALASGKRVAMFDQDLLTLLAYELALEASGLSSQYNELLAYFKDYQKNHFYAVPHGYIILQATAGCRKKRIKNRVLGGRPMGDFCNNALTQSVFRVFIDAVCDRMPTSSFLKLDTTNMPPDSVFKEAERFVEAREATGNSSIPITDAVSLLDRAELIYKAQKLSTA